MIHHRSNPKSLRRAKKLRGRLTRAENALWEILKDAKLGVKFWRQIVLLGWIADFWCPTRKLVIEVDGPSHLGRASYDAFRAKIMRERLGARTIRFTNQEVLTNPLLVEARLRSELQAVPA